MLLLVSTIRLQFVMHGWRGENLFSDALPPKGIGLALLELIFTPTEAAPAAGIMVRVAGLLIASFVSGCNSDRAGRHAISGSVTMDGVPLSAGSISFLPVEGQSTSGGAVILAGKYTVPQGGGLVEGKYRVVINSPSPGSAGQISSSELPGEAPPAPKEAIPAEWNTASRQIVEVKKQGPFVFEFEVLSKSN